MTAPTARERAAKACQSVNNGHDPANCLCCAAILSAIRLAAQDARREAQTEINELRHALEYGLDRRLQVIRNERAKCRNDDNRDFWTFVERKILDALAIRKRGEEVGT